MKYFYSLSTLGFYRDDINPTMPSDAIEVSEEEYMSYFFPEEGMIFKMTNEGPTLLQEGTEE